MATAAQPAPQVVQPSAARKLPSNGEIWVITFLLMFATAGAAIYIRIPGLNWLVAALAMLVFILFLGRWICGRPLGILVTELNVMSLARFQMTVWTLLILSAYVVIALQRLHAGLASPLDIPIDWRLWTLMGISTTSLVGSPLLLDNKRRADPAPASVEKTAQALKEDRNDLNSNRQGVLYSNATPSDARFTDIFQGDEIGNTAYLDLAKLQMFFFTLVIAATYAFAIFHAMAATPDKLAMPVLSEGMIALLGLSHAGYLGGKAADYTPAKQ